MSKHFSALALLSLACVTAPRLPPVAAPRSATPLCGDAPAVAVTAEERDRAYAVFALALAQKPPPNGARCAVSCEASPCLAGCLYEGGPSRGWQPSLTDPEGGRSAGFAYESSWSPEQGQGSTLSYLPVGPWPADSICAKQRADELRATIERSPLPAPRTHASWCPSPADWSTTAGVRATEAAALLAKLQTDCGDLGQCTVECSSWPCQLQCEAPIASDGLGRCVEKAGLSGGTGSVGLGDNRFITRYVVRGDTDPEPKGSGRS